MRCSKAQVNISAVMDGELDQAARAELGQHLETCPDCVLYQQELEKCRVLLRESESAPSAQFEWKIQLGIAKALREHASHSSVEREGRFWLPAGVTAVVTAGLILAVGLWWLGAQSPAGLIDSEEGLATGNGALVQARRQAPLRVFEQESPLRPHVVNTMPEWGRRVRPDWRTPPSMQGQITTVNDLRMLPNEAVNPHMRLGYHSHGMLPAAADSNTVSGSPTTGR